MGDVSNNLEKMDESLRLWAGQVIIRAEGVRPESPPGAATTIVRASASAGRMKGGTQMLALALLHLAPDQRCQAIDEISRVSPGLFNRIMRDLKGRSGMLVRHDLLMTMFNRSWHYVLIDIFSPQRLERVSLAMENARKSA